MGSKICIAHIPLMIKKVSQVKWVMRVHSSAPEKNQNYVRKDVEHGDFVVLLHRYKQVQFFCFIRLKVKLPLFVNAHYSSVQTGHQ